MTGDKFIIDSKKYVYSIDDHNNLIVTRAGISSSYKESLSER